MLKLVFEKNTNRQKQPKHLDKTILNLMKKGYIEMAEINLALSTLYFEVEREAQSYYDDI